MRQLILLQMKLFRVDPSEGGVRILSVFGTFTSVEKIAAVLDKALAIICLGLAGLSYLRALIGVIIGK